MGVIVERSGSAAVVVLDWPEQRNSLGPVEAAELIEAITESALAVDVSGVVLTGNGAFCAGGNLRSVIADPNMSADDRRALVYGPFQGLVRALVDVPVPTVAAIDGAAVGMGFDLALACDVRFVGPDGWGQQGWGRVGLAPGTGGVLLLRRRAPGLLWSLLESQRRLDAGELGAAGVAMQVQEGTARDRAIAFVDGLAEMPRRALEAYVALDRDDLRRDLDAHLALALDHQVGLLASPDFAERISSILG